MTKPTYDIYHNPRDLSIVGEASAKCESNDTKTRLGDINRNALTLQSYKGEMINAGLNTEYFWQEMLRDALGVRAESIASDGGPVNIEDIDVDIKGKDARTEETQALSVSSSPREVRLSDLNPDQKKAFENRLKLLNRVYGETRFTDFCIKKYQQEGVEIGFGTMKETTFQGKKSKTLQWDPIDLESFVAEGSSRELESQDFTPEKILKLCIKMRKDGESFPGRMATLKKIFDSLPQVDEKKKPEAWENQAVYYDRVASYYEILVGDEIDDNKIERLMQYFHVDMPAEQALFVTSENTHIGLEQLGLKVILGFDDNANQPTLFLDVEREMVAHQVELKQLESKPKDFEETVLINNQPKKFLMSKKDESSSYNKYTQYKNFTQTMMQRAAEKTYSSTEEFNEELDKAFTEYSQSTGVSPMIVQRFGLSYQGTRQTHRNEKTGENEEYVSYQQRYNVVAAHSQAHALAAHVVGDKKPDESVKLKHQSIRSIWQKIKNFVKRSVRGKYYGTPLVELRHKLNQKREQP